ncbi:MAG TPA: hypothetical protein VGK67_09835 [Myxococcales bacterium]
MKKPIKRRDWLVSAVAGIVVGVASATLVMPGAALAMLQRIRWSLGGGGGESADWGELAFYLSIVAVPVGLVTSAVVFFAYRALRKP